ncbi:MAG: TfoX/Sxy family protein [Nitrospirae bacterium]|nr:TfoX/Sxy family protein [Nitrospirota bacterium]
MAYNEALAERVRNVFAKRKGMIERKMFGGIAFMLRGHMCCGVIKDDLVVRVKPEYYEKALTEPHARPMDFTGRPMKGFVFVGLSGYRTDKALSNWIQRGIDFASSLPQNRRHSVIQ